MFMCKFFIRYLFSQFLSVLLFSGILYFGIAHVKSEFKEQAEHFLKSLKDLLPGEENLRLARSVIDYRVLPESHSNTTVFDHIRNIYNSLSHNFTLMISGFPVGVGIIMGCFAGFTTFEAPVIISHLGVHFLIISMVMTNHLGEIFRDLVYGMMFFHVSYNSFKFITSCVQECLTLNHNEHIDRQKKKSDRDHFMLKTAIVNWTSLIEVIVTGSTIFFLVVQENHLPYRPIYMIFSGVCGIFSAIQLRSKKYSVILGLMSTIAYSVTIMVVGYEIPWFSYPYMTAMLLHYSAYSAAETSSQYARWDFQSVHRNHDYFSAQMTHCTIRSWSLLGVAILLKTTLAPLLFNNALTKMVENVEMKGVEEVYKTLEGTLHRSARSVNLTYNTSHGFTYKPTPFPTMPITEQPFTCWCELNKITWTLAGLVIFLTVLFVIMMVLCSGFYLSHKKRIQRFLGPILMTGDIKRSPEMGLPLDIEGKTAAFLSMDRLIGHLKGMITTDDLCNDTRIVVTPVREWTGSLYHLPQILAGSSILTLQGIKKHLGGPIIISAVLGYNVQSTTQMYISGLEDPRGTWEKWLAWALLDNMYSLISVLLLLGAWWHFTRKMPEDAIEAHLDTDYADNERGWDHVIVMRRGKQSPRLIARVHQFFKFAMAWLVIGFLLIAITSGHYIDLTGRPEGISVWEHVKHIDLDGIHSTILKLRSYLMSPCEVGVDVSYLSFYGTLFSSSYLVGTYITGDLKKTSSPRWYSLVPTMFFPLATFPQETQSYMVADQDDPRGFLEKWLAWILLDNTVMLMLVLVLFVSWGLIRRRVDSEVEKYSVLDEDDDEQPGEKTVFSRVITSREQSTRIKRTVDIWFMIMAIWVVTALSISLLSSGTRVYYRSEKVAPLHSARIDHEHYHIPIRNHSCKVITLDEVAKQDMTIQEMWGMCLKKPTMKHRTRRSDEDVYLNFYGDYRVFEDWSDDAEWFWIQRQTLSFGHKKGNEMLGCKYHEKGDAYFTNSLQHTLADVDENIANPCMFKRIKTDKSIQLSCEECPNERINHVESGLKSVVKKLNEHGQKLKDYGEDFKTLKSHVEGLLTDTEIQGMTINQLVEFSHSVIKAQNLTSAQIKVNLFLVIMMIKDVYNLQADKEHAVLYRYLKAVKPVPCGDLSSLISFTYHSNEGADLCGAFKTPTGFMIHRKVERYNSAEELDLVLPITTKADIVGDKFGIVTTGFITHPTLSVGSLGNVHHARLPWYERSLHVFPVTPTNATYSERKVKDSWVVGVEPDHFVKSFPTTRCVLVNDTLIYDTDSSITVKDDTGERSLSGHGQHTLKGEYEVLGHQGIIMKGSMTKKEFHDRRILTSPHIPHDSDLPISSSDILGLFKTIKKINVTKATTINLSGGYNHSTLEFKGFSELTKSERQSLSEAQKDHVILQEVKTKQEADEEKETIGLVAGVIIAVVVLLLVAGVGSAIYTQRGKLKEVLEGVKKKADEHMQKHFKKIDPLKFSIQYNIDSIIPVLKDGVFSTGRRIFLTILSEDHEAENMAADITYLVDEHELNVSTDGASYKVLHTSLEDYKVILCAGLRQLKMELKLTTDSLITGPGELSIIIKGQRYLPNGLEYNKEKKDVVIRRGKLKKLFLGSKDKDSVV